jgi:hypothetical protein
MFLSLFPCEEMANTSICFKQTKNTRKGLKKHEINWGSSACAFSGGVS